MGDSNERLRKVREKADFKSARSAALKPAVDAALEDMGARRTGEAAVHEILNGGGIGALHGKTLRR